jgi:hypothetical protein
MIACQAYLMPTGLIWQPLSSLIHRASQPVLQGDYTV